MHLFASFMTRAFIALLKHSIFVWGLGLSSDVLVAEGESYWLNDQTESNWQCKAFTSVWQYFILANYSWILMEGLYLHNLVFLALFTDSNSSIAGYVVLGWGKIFFSSLLLFVGKIKIVVVTIIRPASDICNPLDRCSSCFGGYFLLDVK